MYKTAQEKAKAELAKKIKDGRKKDPYFMMSPAEKQAAFAQQTRKLDRFLITQARASGLDRDPFFAPLLAQLESN